MKAILRRTTGIAATRFPAVPFQHDVAGEWRLERGRF